jgi:signal transduction histidine kinase
MDTSQTPSAPLNRRILVVDDNAAIHDDFREVLAPATAACVALDAEAARLFDEPLPPAELGFEVDSAHQGRTALEMVHAARAAGRPYALAFVDMRMPPGWDGLTTISHVFEADPEIQTVICTAYSDRSWADIHAALASRDRWLVLKKPFDKVEVLQLAHALTEKWTLGRLASMKVEALEQMVQARTLDLQNAHRVKSEFLACASHELLTPLHGVCGFQDLLSETPLTADQRDYLQAARTSSARLHGLVGQIIDFNQTEAGTLVLEPVEFAPARLLESILNDFGHGHTPVRLAVDASRLAPARWRASERYIRKALVSLLDNALKFTSRGSVTLAVETHPPGLAFSVIDTGIGLTPEQVEWIKIPFAQVDGGTSRRNSGMGLGLPLARRLAEAMGGTLTVDGQPEQGVVARFTVAAQPVGVQRTAAGA